MAASPQKVLIHRLGSLGDTAFLMPVFHHLNEIWPDAEKRVLTNFPVAAAAPPLQAVLGDGAFADGYFAYPIGSRNPAALWGLARDIRAWGPDVAVYINAVKPTLSVIRDGLFLRLCGARGIVGLPLARRRRQHVFDAETGLFERETARIARAVEGLGSIDINRLAGKDLGLTDAERAKAAEILSDWDGAGNFICFSPGTKQAIKDWTDPNWISVLERLSAAAQTLGIVVVGADGDRARSDALLRCWQGPHINTCGEVSPRVSAALMADALFFLGNDSGPMHLAAAVDTPAVAVFSRHARPGIWFPLGDGHRIFYPGLSWSGGDPV
ncbi:unnamed protein product, partial [Discosporangium mesarthrocarpum]